MEGLNVVLKSAVEKGIFNGVKIPGNEPTLSHLFYVDDVLFVGEWSRTNLQNLARILNCFHISSGLKANFHKSKAYGLGVQNSEVLSWANLLGCEASSLPFKYLRVPVPVGANMNLIKIWKPIIDKYHSKFSLWKAKSLSFARRLNLIKSVLGNLPNYLSLFVAPKGVIEKLEKTRRKFLWGGNEDKSKIHWISWDKIIKSKKEDRLVVRSIRAIGLIVKRFWRLKTETSSLWNQVIRVMHNLTSKPNNYFCCKKIIGTCKNIGAITKETEKNDYTINDIFKISIKSREDTLFWQDKWTRDQTLQRKYPKLYDLEP